MFDLDLELSEMTLLKFRDFVPKRLSKNIWTGRGEYQPLIASLKEANAWLIHQPGIDLVNIETVVLPSLHSDKEEGSEDPELMANTGGSPQSWHQFIRVWYVERK